MNLKGLINKGDKEIDEDAKLFIGKARLRGSRKSAVKSMLLEMGYKKEGIDGHIDDMWRIADGFKKTDPGKQMVKEFNKEKLNDGFKFLFMSLVLFVVEYALYYFLDFQTPIIFSIFVLPGIYYLFRGISGL
jgi:hypothetical protein